MEKLHDEILERMRIASAYSYDLDRVIVKKVNRSNIKDYISIGAAIGLLSQDLEDLLLTFTLIDEALIKSSVKSFFKISYAKAILHDGVIYNSSLIMQRQLKLSERQVRWMITKGEAEYIEGDTDETETGDL